ncbi:MAG: universal stress protein [Bacteroidia bacterium]|nr:universal stress protein [Bacteroidia bacterium]
MKKILVLTDFSPLAKIVVSYAIGLAKILEARIILVSVINAGSSTNTLNNWRKLEEEMIKGAQEDADRLIKKVKKEADNVQLTYECILGFPMAEVVDGFAVKNKVDFIVMGTRGASGLLKVIVGSNATAVINRSSIPVIVVPGKARFKKIRKVVYATDLQNLEKEIITATQFARSFDAPLDVLHVRMASSNDQIEELDRNMARATKENRLIKTANYPKIQFHELSSENISDAVDKFVNDQKADFLIMFTHRLLFYEKLFGKSVTREQAFHSKVPMLTFNKTNLTNLKM